MVLGDYQRFECAYYLVMASRYGTDLSDAFRWSELSYSELLVILHRIEWDDGVRLFKIHEHELRLTREGEARVAVWRAALLALGI
jgi:hypothetical protein